ncbi:TetR/AcrR family transcriptional regulator [Embleya sp. NPDC050493]|uniref:TetR/AcrR family transcriptional regulator n=1 Tax=Embleya sp. NPDC050493 TaxID=3363989 RepID=UPI00378FAFEB
MTTDGTDAPVRGKRSPEGETRSTPRRALVEKQIFEHAIALFSERGFAGTTLQDIAKATGLTRPALYHYVSSKEDLLAKLVDQDAGGIADRLHEIASETGRSAVERLHTMVYASARRMARDPARFRLLLRSEGELPREIFRSYDKGRRRVLLEFTTVIQDGIAAGRFRPVDARTAALCVIGMTNWIAWWYNPGQKPGEDEIAAQFADMAVQSLVLVTERAVSADGPERAIALLRQDLDLLENLLKDH